MYVSSKMQSGKEKAFPSGEGGTALAVTEEGCRQYVYSEMQK